MILLRNKPPLYLIEADDAFPSLDDDTLGDLVCIGGDLSPNRLLKAYRSGLFPWYVESGAPYWYSPRVRMILEPNALRISKSLARVIKSARFEIKYDTAFKQTMVSCARVKRKNENDTWITREFIEGYGELHKLGFARSIEAWQEDKLVGGLYGVQIGRVFCGESAFAFKTDASKTALAAFRLAQPFGAIDTIDCQVPSEHFASLGGVEISRAEYLSLLSTKI